MSLSSLGEAGARVGEALMSRVRAALALGQRTRLLQIETALPSASLVVERCVLTEAVHATKPMWAEVDCLSTHALLALKALVGEQVSLRLLQADGSWRHWHGFVVRASQLGADGGVARYRLSLAAWTHWMTLRRDARIFQDQTPQDIVSAVMAAYPQANFRFEVATPGTLKPITTQYRETDWDFVQRIMAGAGWSWRLEHGGDASAEQTQAQMARHCLVIGDAQAPMPNLGEIRFSRPDMRDERGAHDTITGWQEGQRIAPNVVTVAAWDERQLMSVGAQGQRPDLPGVPALEVYAAHGERRFVDGRVADAQVGSVAEAASTVEAMLAVYAQQAAWVQGSSAVRRLQEGAQFGLVDHSAYDLSAVLAGRHRFTVVSVTHEAANNLGTDLANWLGSTDIEQGSYRNHFAALPATLRLVAPSRDRPTAPGLQTAIVVAQEGEVCATDRDGRIRIQFPWQRGEAPLPGGLPQLRTPSGQPVYSHAPGDARSGTWVRVAQTMAGANWGAVFTPRAGTEVLVDFVDGDIDKPVVIGQLHNGQHDLPWPAGAGTEANHPGHLSGWHSPHWGGGGANQWVIDDTPGQLRMRLACHGWAIGWSELSLGHMVQHSGQGGVGHAQRGGTLGAGFYGATDGWAIVRAAEGLLLTTTARAALGSSVHSTQMDAAEAVAQLKASRQLGEVLGQSAQQQGAQGLASHDAGQAFEGHTDAMDLSAAGCYQGSVGGQVAQKAEGRTLTGPVERFAKPLLHLDTPVSASFVTPSSISLFSGLDTSVVTQEDVHICAVHTVSAVSGQTTSLYTHSGGIQAIAANGDVSVRAHTDAQQIWSEKDLTVQSTTDEIRVQASKSITLTAGQSQIVLDGGNITFTCPGTWTVKGASHDWSGGGSRAAQLSGLPDARVGEQPRWLELKLMGWEGKPLPGVPYEVQFADGSKRHGTLDSDGFAHLDGVPEGLEHTVIYQNPSIADDPEPYSLDDLAKSIKAFLGV